MSRKALAARDKALKGSPGTNCAEMPRLLNDRWASFRLKPLPATARLEQVDAHVADLVFRRAAARQR